MEQWNFKKCHLQQENFFFFFFINRSCHMIMPIMIRINRVAIEHPSITTRSVAAKRETERQAAGF